MDIVTIVLQSLLAFAFFFSGASKLAGAKMQVDTFSHLGLPQWFRIVTGIVQVIGAAGLIVGFWKEGVLAIAALWLVCTMLGAVMSHIRAKDPIGKIVPAAVLLGLALVLASLNFSALTDLI